MQLPLGSLFNAAAIVVGGLLGLAFRRFLPDRLTRTVIQVLGVFTAAVGLKMILAGQEDLLVLICLVIGSFIGEWLSIEGFVERVGRLTDKFSRKHEEGPAKGFVATTLIYCVGSMAIVGSLTEGVTGDARILLTKGIIDGIASIAFAATLGYGVLLSSISILVYQGSITLLAGYLQNYLAGPVITEVTAAGGYLLVLLSLNILEIKRIRVANILPALALVMVVMLIKAKIG